MREVFQKIQTKPYLLPAESLKNVIILDLRFSHSDGHCLIFVSADVLEKLIYDFHCSVTMKISLGCYHIGRKYFQEGQSFLVYGHSHLATE